MTLAPTPSSPVMVVSGGAAGIGLASASRWIQSGGRAVLVDRDASAAERAAATLGEAARGVGADVTSRTAVDAALASVAAVEGRVDALVNCAGIARPAPAATMSDDDLSVLLDIHVTGTLRMCRAAYPLLKASGGRIVNIASVAALAGMPQRLNYTAAKSAIGGLTRTLAVEWGPEGIRTNAVGPGYVRSALTETLKERGELRTEGIEARTALGRFGEPAEIAECVYFLASEASSFVNGHLLMADGGLTIDGNWY